MNYKDSLITVFSDVKQITNGTTHRLETILEGHKKNKQQNLIEKIRSTTDKKERNTFKAKLPSIMFSGVFDKPIEKVDSSTGEVYYSERENDSLSRHSHVVAIDYDNIDPYKLKPKLKLDTYILACWTSPSGNGVKALVKISEPSKHKQHYNSIISHFSKYGEVDTSNKNVGRVTYLSYDPAIYINWDSWVYSGTLEDKKEKTLETFTGAVHNYDYSKIMPSVKMIRNSLIGERNTTFVKAARLAGGYVGSGYLPEKLAKLVLRSEYNKVNPEEDDKDSLRALENGLEYGKQMPIYDFNKFEEESLKDIGESVLDFLADTDKEVYDLMKWYKGDKMETFTTGFGELDKNWVWKSANLIIMLGHEGLGKTLLSNFFAVQAAITHGWHSVILPMEDPIRWVIRDMAQFAAGKLMKDMTEAEVKYYVDFILTYFHFIEPNNQTIPGALEQIDKVMGRKDVKTVVLEPYNSFLRKNPNVYANDTQMAAMMANFAHSRNVNLWLNIHTRSEARRSKHENGEFAGLTKFPSKYDAEMGGLWSNKADAFLTTHRYDKHPVASERFKAYISVDKIKDKLTGGEPHGLDEHFAMQLNNMHTFTCTTTGERAFEPLKMNIGEL